MTIATLPPRAWQRSEVSRSVTIETCLALNVSARAARQEWDGLSWSKRCRHLCAWRLTHLERTSKNLKKCSQNKFQHYTLPSLADPTSSLHVQRPAVWWTLTPTKAPYASAKPVRTPRQNAKHMCGQHCLTPSALRIWPADGGSLGFELFPTGLLLPQQLKR